MRTTWIFAPAVLTVVVAIAVMAADAEQPKTDDKPPVNLVPNGDFEAGDVTPTGWQTIDGMSTFWVKDDDPKHGKVVKFDTDINQQEGYDWWVKIAKGASPKDAPKKTPTVGDKYDTLAGNDGVWFWSDFIPVEKGKAYWLTIDAKGPPMLAWLMGYPEKTSTDFGADEGAFVDYLQAKLSGKPKDVSRGHASFIHNYAYKGQMSLGGSDEWKTYSRSNMPFRPTSSHTPNVKYVRVMILPTWPPGVYYVDNVKLTEVEDKDADQKPGE